MNNKIIIFDTTLRDGEQSPGATMNTEEKLRIAFQLEKLGVDVIEAGFPAASVGDFEAVSAISKTIKDSEVAALCRTNKKDIERAWGAIKNAAKPKIHTFIASSDIHMKYKLKMNRDEVLKMAFESVKYAKSFTSNIEFSAEDGSRSDADFLCRIFEKAIEAGAKTINLPDTVGYAVPNEFASLINYVMKNTKGIENAILSVHCHNDLGLATANTITAVQEGARQVEVTINGIGERAGNTSLEEFVMALKTRKNILNLSTNINSKEIYKTSRLVSSITGIMVQPNKAIVGANAFAHEAGIHQDGVLKNPMTYEIMLPETIGLNTNKLVLGKHSGKHALKEQLKEMGYKLSETELIEIFKKFKEISDKKKEISNDDLEALVTEKILRSTKFFKLENLYVESGSDIIPKAKVTMNIKGKICKSEGTGNGPIDAVFNAISKLINKKPSMLRFVVSAITGGTDAQGEVTVRLKYGKHLALGRSCDLDIIKASAKAYINGINRLENMSL